MVVGAIVVVVILYLIVTGFHKWPPFQYRWLWPFDAITIDYYTVRLVSSRLPKLSNYHSYGRKFIS